MLEILIPVSYLLAVLIHAKADAVKTKNGKPVNHLLGAFFYTAASLGLFLLFRQTSNATILQLIMLPLLTRAAFFDSLYNKFIGKHWLYEGTKKPKRKESIIDTIERIIGLPVGVYRLIYFAAYGIYLGIFIFQYK